MSTTQIPPTSPAASKPRQPEGGDLYDPRYWESAYRDIDQAPTLLIQLQDDLTRAHRREAFWLSVAAHLVVVLLLVNSNQLARLLPHGAVISQQNISPRDKDLTYLELPPDEQKLTKRPNTNIISDKDRIATSKTPQLDRQALKKILDSSRPGTPSVPVPTPPPSPQAATQNAAPQQQQAPQAPPVNQNQQEARLQTPPPPAHNPFASGGYVGDQVAQAARGAATNRGGYGDGGDFGLGSRREGCIGAGWARSAQRHHGRRLRPLSATRAVRGEKELVQPNSAIRCYEEREGWD